MTQMLLLPMMMINNIKHINISKPLCLNHLPLQLIPIYYDPNVTLAYDDDKQYEAHKYIKATMSKSSTFEIDTHLL